MTLITIREGSTKPNANATLLFDGGEESPIRVSDPFSDEQEKRLAWYFEEHLQFPFTHQVKAQHAAASVAEYGHALFNQIFADRQAYARYTQARANGINSLQFEISGEPEFHRLHWETLKDPDLPKAFALETTMVRRSKTFQTVQANLRESPTLNLLVVTARPMGRSDVAYRTIARPLVDAVENADLNVRLEFVRPGTYRALSETLERARDAHGAGYYHIIHFDVHGVLLTFEQLSQAAKADRLMFQSRYGRGDLEKYEGLRAFLSFEDAHAEKPDLVEAGELARLLTVHHVPIAILNACQSGKQVGDTETSLASRLMDAGVQVAVGMGYSVTVSAARLLMQMLYRELLQGQPLANALRRGRLELYNDKGRRAYFNQTIDLEDWMLPVVYQNRALKFTPRAFTETEAREFYETRAHQFKPQEPSYGFQGRDLDILEIERALLRRNLLLVRGMGGAGKTTLLKHLGAWWQKTNWVGRVFYFGYDEKAYTRQHILHSLAQQLLSPVEFASQFQPLGLDAQQALVVQRLRARRHLLLLDNLESITGVALAIQNTLPPDEQRALKQFLTDLAGGQTLVLLGSRGGEEWLRDGTFADNVYELTGLDPEAASTLADLILERQHATKYRKDENLKRLIELCAGYPLALQVLLENLARQTPAEILNALQAGEEQIDFNKDTGDKTQSILQCIAYSHSNLAPDAQQLLTCLAPFTSVINAQWLPQYTERLRAQPALAHLPFEQWDKVLQQAANWGLLEPHEVEGYLTLQPTLPYFLRARLNAPAQAETKHAVETAFREHYDGIGGALTQAMQSKEPREKQIGELLARFEYENLHTALMLALDARVSILMSFLALSFYLDARQAQRRGLELGEMVLARLESYPNESLTGELGVEFVTAIDDIAGRYLLLKQYDRAKQRYEKVLALISNLTKVDSQKRGQMNASVYHQLGMVAQEQRQLAQAEQYYQQALQIKIEFNDRYSQADTYHQLGSVAQEERQWVQAEQYYQRALQIEVEFNERYAQADTYHNLGMVAQEQRQWVQAEQHYHHALQIEVEFDDRYSQARTYHQLGRVAEEQRQWAQAEQYYQQALQLKIEFNDRYSQASTYGQLGLLAQAQEQWAQARQYLMQALEIFVAYQDEYNIGVTFRNLARLWHASGDADLPAAVAGVFGVDVKRVEEAFAGIVKDEG